MIVRIQFFSRLREIAGANLCEREWENGITVGEALAKLEVEFPALADWEGKLLFAVGVEFVQRDHVLEEGDLLSVMPPVQGG